MGYLNFTEYKKREEAELVPISDGFGNTILMPKLGYLTWREKKILSEYMAEVTKKVEILVPEVEFTIAALLTKERLKIDSSVPNQEVMLDGEGESISEALVKQIYDFFIKEQLKWDEKAIADWQAQVEAQTQSSVDRAIANWETNAESKIPEASEEKIQQSDIKSRKKGFSK